MEGQVYRLHLIHWNEAEAAERGNRLRAAGYQVDHQAPGSAGVRRLFTDPPDTFVIDLSRMPSQGRDVAVLLRKREATRHVPIVFVSGESAKVERTRQVIPDAVFTSWQSIEGDLAAAIAVPPSDPVVPDSAFAAYAGTPLVKKLGIKPGSAVALVNPPDGFDATLGPLPDGAALDRLGPEESDLVILFTMSRVDLEEGVGSMADILGPSASMWIAWPKKASRVATDLTQNAVRELGLAAGLVDYKICSIDKTWSGLLFTHRKR